MSAQRAVVMPAGARVTDKVSFRARFAAGSIFVAATVVTDAMSHLRVSFMALAKLTSADVNSTAATTVKTTRQPPPDLTDWRSTEFVGGAFEPASVACRASGVPGRTHVFTRPHR